MATTATIVEDRIQGTTHRNIRLRFTHDGSGESVDIGPRQFPQGVDLQAWADAKAPVYDARFIQKEKDRLRSGVVDGTVDPETVVLHYHTRNQVRTFLAKALFNAMRDAETSNDKLTAVKRLLVVIKPFTDAQIAGLVPWTEAQVMAARVKLVAFRDAIDNLDHGLGEL